MVTNNDMPYNWRLRKSYLTSIVSISLVLFLLGAMCFLILNAGRLSDYVRENIGFAIMLNDNIKEADVLRLQKILDAAPYTKSTQYVTKEQAAERLKTDLGEDFVEFLGYNPLLPSIEVQLHANYANMDSISSIEARLTAYKQVKEIYYQRLLIQQVNENVRKISLIILIFGAMLMLISVALINNSIRLAIHAKRFLINTMRLVGATETFIQKPFLITAALNGALGGMLANLILMGLIRIVHREIEQVVSVEYIVLLLIGIIVAGMIITVLSTYYAVNKYLNMNIDKLYEW